MKIDNIRHSLSHIMAHAVKDIFKDVKFGIGPTIENGFYYDFDLKKALTPEDLPKIEKRMKELIKQDIKFEKRVISKNEVKKMFSKQPYKLDLINEKSKTKDQNLTIYKSGDFTDLCSGPHIKSTLQLHSGQAKEIINAFKLTKIAGAYWRGSEKNPMLQRIYGIAFETKKELNEFVKRQEEAEKRDHRTLGQKLDLFSIDEEVGPGLILWHPKGALLRQIIEDYWIEEHLKNNYELLKSPHVGRKLLWQTSGHTNFYKENMYGPMEVEGDEYLIKPMNCPFHMKIYKTKSRSYRDLPLKWAELGTVYRFERSGVLHGLTRVRGFTQDDAHIICTPKQLADEVMTATKFGIRLLQNFGFKDLNIYLSTRPEKYVGTLANWKKATDTLKSVLNKLKLKYQTDEGGGVFYGPKIDIKIKDAIGREWQCTTVQFDFNLPERFDLFYIDEKGKKQRPYMVHRALLGSIERFVGVLLEHYAGALPLWLSPTQIQILPIGEKHKKHAKEIFEKLKEFRVQLKDENETLNKKIREAETQKIPYTVIVGDKEIKTKSLSIRSHKDGDIGTMKLEKFIGKIKNEVENKN